MRSGLVTAGSNPHHTVTLTREPTGDGALALALVCRDCASVVKNSLSLSAVLVAVTVAVLLAVSAGVVLAAPVVVAGSCNKFNTLEKAASNRVTPRLGGGDAASVLGTVLAVAGVVVVCPAAAVVLAADAAEFALAVVAGAVPKDCANCSSRCTKLL